MESRQVIKSHSMTIIPLRHLRLYKQPFWGKQSVLWLWAIFIIGVEYLVSRSMPGFLFYIAVRIVSYKSGHKMILITADRYTALYSSICKRDMLITEQGGRLMR